MAFQTYNPRVPARKDVMTLTIGLHCGFGISPLTLEALGHAKEVVLEYDPENFCIRLRRPRDASEPRIKVTFDRRKDGRDGGHVSGTGFCNRFHIKVRQATRMEGRHDGGGVAFVLPPEARPRPEGAAESPNGQRQEHMAGTRI